MTIIDTPERTSKVVDLATVASLVDDGDTVGVGGVHSQNSPMALVRAVARSGVNDLTLVTSPSAGMAADLLIAAGCVSRIYCCYIGMEFLGFAPNFRRAAESGTIDVIESDEAGLIYGLRAGAAGLPFIPFPALYEATDLPRVNPLIKRTIDPYTGNEVCTVPPIRCDVSLFHAQRSDPYGNATQFGTTRVDDMIASASDRVVVSTDEVIPAADPRHDPQRVTFISPIVTAVVDVPYGAHPTASPGRYDYDEPHIRRYVDHGRADTTTEYLDSYVGAVDSHSAYLELIGLTRLLELRLA